jgi:hypothetical protein
LKKAVIVGLTLSFLVSLILMFADALIKIRNAGYPRDLAGTSVIVSTATAAVPATEMFASAAPVVIGAGSSLDEFRLNPDSCCINHY